MTQKFITRRFGSQLTTPIASYDPDRVNLGTLMCQSNGAGVEDKWVGPFAVQMVRPVELGGAVSAKWPFAVKRTSTSKKVWIFTINAAGAAATRQFSLYEFDYSVTPATLALVGHIVVTFPVATNSTTRGFEVDYSKYTTGTVAVSGTAVTGTSTLWTTNRLCVGSRIKFNTTDPEAAGTWYEITAIGGEGSITIGASAGTISAGASYVIEDLRIIHSTTNATATNGGLFVIKGLSADIFNSTTPTAIPAATTVDSIRASYWLADAATVTNTLACGGASAPTVSQLVKYHYVLDGNSTTAKFYKYNTRVALTSLSSGKSTEAFVLATGTQTLPNAGNVQTQNNCILATTSHGPGSGVECIYFGSSVYNSYLHRVTTAAITSASTTFLADNMTETPPGGQSAGTGITYTIIGTAVMPAYDPYLDGFHIEGSTISKRYFTKYRTDGTNFENVFNADSRQSDQSIAHADSVPHPSGSTTQSTSAFLDGWMFFCRATTLASLNQIYAVPYGAHWATAAAKSQEIIFPREVVPSDSTLSRITFSNVDHLGGDYIGSQLDPFRTYARVSGITDNSGSWTLVNNLGDISALTPSGGYVQFKVQFKTMTDRQLPARILEYIVAYDEPEEEDGLPEQLEWSLTDSDPATSTVGFKQITPWGGAGVPVLTISYYLRSDDTLQLQQASSGSANGTFEYHNGTIWTAGLGPDADGTRRRFVPSAELPAGDELYVEITVP